METQIKTGFYYVTKNVINAEMETIFRQNSFIFISSIEYSQYYNEKYDTLRYTAKISTTENKIIILHEYNEKDLQKKLSDLFATVPPNKKNLLNH